MLQLGRTLHVGTATGRISAYLVEKGHDYVGIEISRVMARITKEKLNVHGSIIRADAEHLPFRPRIFDNVVCARMFHFLPRPAQFLSQAFTVLKPNGRFIVSFEKRVAVRTVIGKLGILPTPLVRRRFYYNVEASRLVANAGFEIRFLGNVTKLPLVVYRMLKKDTLLRKVHHALP